MHRRRLLRGRGEQADIRDGEDRAAGFHGPTDTHLRPSLKLDDWIQCNADAFHTVTSLSLRQCKTEAIMQGQKKIAYGCLHLNRLCCAMKVNEIVCASARQTRRKDFRSMESAFRVRFSEGGQI